jgi:hypothetical protein
MEMLPIRSLSSPDALPEYSAALRQVEQGIAAEEITRKMGISEATLYSWKKEFPGMEIGSLLQIAVQGCFLVSAEIVELALYLLAILLCFM